MSVLVTTDLHFTDSPKDAHRWELLPWLAKQAKKYNAEAVFLLGDLTDAKDKHSAALTNRMVRGLQDLAASLQQGTSPDVVAIRGNHDYIDENEPFFGFMDEGAQGSIRFLTKPTQIRFRSVGECLFLPNTRDYQKEWNSIMPERWSGPYVPKYIFTHQTYDGCLTETGFKMEGIPPSVWDGFKGKVYSGDIHKPQVVTRKPWIEYVGAPYRCRFGDDYEPRVLLIKDDGTTKDLHFPTKNKALVNLNAGDALAAYAHRLHMEGEPELFEGDQVKVRVELSRAQYGEWPKLRAQIVKDAADLGLELTGPELVALPDQPAKAAPAPQKGGLQPQTGPQGAVLAYAAQKGASKGLREAGLAMLAQAQGGK